MCVLVFLYGFFLSFSSSVPAYFDRRPGKKYASHTLLIYRSLSAKLNTMGLTMATISLLFTVTLICEGTGMLFSALFESRVDGSTCFDIFVGTEASGIDADDSEEAPQQTNNNDAAISDSSATAQTAAPQANNPPRALLPAAYRTRNPIRSPHSRSSSLIWNMSGTRFLCGPPCSIISTGEKISR